MTSINLSEVERLVMGDLERRIAAINPGMFSYIDFTAMANSAIRHRSGLIKDPLTFLSDQRELVSMSLRGTISDHVITVVTKSLQPKLDALFVSQLADNFQEKYESFCDTVLTHLRTIESKNSAPRWLTDDFLDVVEAEKLNLPNLGKIVEHIRSALTENFMSDAKGEITKAYQIFEKAIHLGLFGKVEYVPYRSHAAQMVSKLNKSNP